MFKNFRIVCRKIAILYQSHYINESHNSVTLPSEGFTNLCPDHQRQAKSCPDSTTLMAQYQPIISRSLALDRHPMLARRNFVQWNNVGKTSQVVNIGTQSVMQWGTQTFQKWPNIGITYTVSWLIVGTEYFRNIIQPLGHCWATIVPIILCLKWAIIGPKIH